jgi:pimeloyl-ACP methyl ester carboxylesterase
MLDEARRAVESAELIVGASLGGWLALHAAAHAPRARLLLLAPVVSIHALDTERPWLAALWRTFGAPVLDKADRRIRRVDASLLDEMRVLGAPPNPDVDVEVVHGRRDLLSPLAASRKWVAAHDRARLLEVDDGHELSRCLPQITSIAVRLLTERPRNNRFSGSNRSTGSGGNAPSARRLRRGEQLRDRFFLGL